MSGYIVTLDMDFKTGEMTGKNARGRVCYRAPIPADLRDMYQMVKRHALILDIARKTRGMRRRQDRVRR